MASRYLRNKDGMKNVVSGGHFLRNRIENEEQMELGTPQETSAFTGTTAPCKEEQSLQRELENGKEVTSPIQMVPSALRNYEMYLKVDRKRLLSDEDFNRVCVIVAGDQRRIFQRVLMGIYQRAFEKKDSAEVKRARLLLSLHERGALFQSLEVVG